MARFDSIRHKGILFFARTRLHAYELVAILLVFACVSGSTAQTASPKTLADLQSTDLATQFQAVQTLRLQQDPAAADALGKTLRRATNANLRLTILDALAALKAPSSVVDIAPLLRDPRPAIRQRAALSMGVLGSPAAERPLAKALRTEKDATVKGALLQALGLCGTNDSVADIQNAVSDSKAPVRANAIHALQRIHDAQPAKAKGAK